MATDTLVYATDFVDTRENQHGIFNQAGITDVYDFNRGKLVNATDMILSRDHQTPPFTMSQLISAPSAADGAGSASVSDASSETNAPASSTETTLQTSSSTGQSVSVEPGESHAQPGAPSSRLGSASSAMAKKTTRHNRHPAHRLAMAGHAR